MDKCKVASIHTESCIYVHAIESILVGGTHNTCAPVIQKRQKKI